MPLERDIPQGSPLSVTLYLLYSPELLLADQIKTSSTRISIGYIDDVTHIVSAKTEEEALEKLSNVSSHTLDWVRKTGSEFDKKKTSFMVFKPKGNTDTQFNFVEKH
ncbi:hypothetical protein O181_066246 [Austropuccinia psidii MF-1]|uniref:Reverse transcriptase domain-containing protein n=1 Tax=Austropuccinia psidii MF-1 TaxID=1389203 RepID=A0A9Q3EQJ8_9BASI|nr:hypothetical protein [Austropuccinia psidii MF-1]